MTMAPGSAAVRQLEAGLRRAEDPGTLDIWGEPFTFRRLPLFFNLRMDPYKRAEITSNTYWDWSIRKAYLLMAGQAIVAELYCDVQGISATAEAAELLRGPDYGEVAAAGERLIAEAYTAASVKMRRTSPAMGGGKRASQCSAAPGAPATISCSGAKQALSSCPSASNRARARSPSVATASTRTANSRSVPSRHGAASPCRGTAPRSATASDHPAPASNASAASAPHHHRATRPRTPIAPPSSPGAGIRSAHFQKPLDPDIGERRGHVVGKIAHGRGFTGQVVQPPCRTSRNDDPATSMYLPVAMTKYIGTSTSHSAKRSKPKPARTSPPGCRSVGYRYRSRPVPRMRGTRSAGLP